MVETLRERENMFFTCAIAQGIAGDMESLSNEQHSQFLQILKSNHSLLKE